MKYVKIVILLVVIFGAYYLIRFWLTVSPPQQPGPSSASKEFTVSKAIEEFPFADRLNQHFIKAREHLYENDPVAAAAEINQAVALLKQESAKGTESGKKGLLESINQLEKLAQDVDGLSRMSAKELNASFARAHYAMAMHRYLSASNLAEREQFGEATVDLQAAAQHLEKAIALSEETLDEETAKVLDKIRSSGRELGLDIKKLIQDFDKVLSDWGEKFRSVKQSAASQQGH
jgi:hypothetical protein